MNLSRTWIAFVCLGLWVSACGGPRARLPAPQVVAQVDSQAKQNRLQEQLLTQMARIPAGDFKDYQIGPEDLLEINFLDTDKLRREVRVNGQGDISLLLVGTVQVAGLTSLEVEKKLTRLYKEGDFLRDPQINVAVKEYRYQKVVVTGAVNKPDQYSLIGPRTLLEVLGMAGGLSDKAGEVAHIIRGQKGAPATRDNSPRQSFSPGTDTIMVDLNRLLLKGVVDLNFPIQNGDVVHVPFAKTAHVLGSVAKPGVVFLKDNMTVTKAVAQTGGLHIMLSSSQASVLRLDEKGDRQIIPVNFRQINHGSEIDLPLQENDIVYVHEGPVRRFLFDFKTFLPGSLGMSIPAML